MASLDKCHYSNGYGALNSLLSFHFSIQRKPLFSADQLNVLNGLHGMRRFIVGFSHSIEGEMDWE